MTKNKVMNDPTMLHNKDRESDGFTWERKCNGFTGEWPRRQRREHPMTETAKERAPSRERYGFTGEWPRQRRREYPRENEREIMETDNVSHEWKETAKPIFDIFLSKYALASALHHVFFLISIRPIKIWHVASVKLVSKFSVEISFCI